MNNNRILHNVRVLMGTKSVGQNFEIVTQEVSSREYDALVVEGHTGARLTADALAALVGRDEIVPGLEPPRISFTQDFTSIVITCITIA